MAEPRTVGIYDVSAHRHILAYLCKMAATDCNQVIVFTTEVNYDAIEPELETIVGDINWVLKSESQSLGNYLQTVEGIADERLEALMVSAVFGSMRQLFHYASFDPDCQKIVWIFNANRWLNADFALKRGFRGNLHLLFRRRILKNYDAINVEYPPMEEFIEEATDYDRPVFTLMPTLFEGRQAEPPDNRFVCSVPGNIHPMRRDYDLALDVFKELFKEYEDDLEVRLLGRPHGRYGERIVARCQALRDEGYSIKYFDEWIPMETYHRSIQESHVLFCPIYEIAEDAFADEIYGTTKGSGNIFDGLRNGTPLLLPEAFRLSDDIASSTLQYSNVQDLLKRLGDLVSNPSSLEDVCKAAHRNAERFKLSNQRRNFDRVIDELLDGC